MLLSNDDDDGSSCFCAVFLCSVWYVVGAPQTLRRTSFDASKKNKTLCLPVIDHGDAVKVPTGNDESSRVRAVWNSGINQKLLIGYRRGRAREYTLEFMRTN